MKQITQSSKIYFAEEVMPYRVRAIGDRYVVCTKPFNPKRTVLYTVIDLVENVRGTENLVFGMGAETDLQCQEMCARLHGNSGVKTEVSRRNRIPLSIRLIK